MPFLPYVASCNALGHSKENSNQRTDENNWEEVGYSFGRKLMRFKLSYLIPEATKVLELMWALKVNYKIILK